MTQPALDFTVPVSVYATHEADVAAERDRLDTAKARILARLQQGPADNVTLNGICFRYGARILELRHAGYQIEKAHLGGGRWLYTLVQP